jgi:hypothetical protein
MNKTLKSDYFSSIKSTINYNSIIRKSLLKLAIKYSNEINDELHCLLGKKLEISE